MMNWLRRSLGDLSPRAMAVLLSLALIAIHSVLLMGSLLRWNATRQLQLQIGNINENVADLDETEAEELRQLQAELASREAEVERLEGELPDPTTPFPLYAQAHNAANTRGVVLLGVERTGMERTATVAGEVNSLLYTIRAQAELDTCLRFISLLEQLGGVELAVQGTRIQPETESCNFEVLTVALRE